MNSVNKPDKSSGVINNTHLHNDESSGLVHSIKSGLENNEFCLHYQPRFDTATGKANILEALIRWQRPQIGLLYPETFIPAAESSGLIFQLDLWVFEQSCKDLKYFQRHINSRSRLAVNLSVLACESIYFSQKLIEISEKHQVRLSDFEFEITESMYIHDIRKVIAFCQTLSNRGAEFSLDDFGTGQSPLINLYQLPVSSIKIDRSFVQKIGHSSKCEIIITSLVTMSQKLNIKVIAEGIETIEQYRFLCKLGCHQLQGFLLAKPTGLNSIESALLYEPEII